MQKENLDNNPDWRKSLLNLDALPGEPVPALSESWEKLQSRLEQKSGRIKPIWWFLAAACAVVAFFISTTNRQPEKTISRVDETKIEEPTKIVLYQPESMVKKSIIVSKKPSPQSVNQYKNTTIADTSIAIETDSIANAPIYTMIDSPSVVPKKKLRVMHINELGSYNGNLRQEFVRNTSPDKILNIPLAPSN